MSRLDHETPRELSDRRARKRFVGMLLMSAGGLLALLCGLCTLVLSIGFIASPGTVQSAANLTFLLIPLIVGGVPTAIGVMLFWIGLGMYREGREPRTHSERTFD
jgi:hypothetical protein